MKASKKREKSILQLDKQSKECQSRIKRANILRRLKKKMRKQQRELEEVKLQASRGRV